MPAVHPPAPAALFRRSWLRRGAAALAGLLALDKARSRRADNGSGVGDGAAADGAPRLVVPARSNASYQWLDETRQMFLRREWRLRQVDYENAPFGRPVYSSSLYRWWLGALAGAAHALRGDHLASALEAAARVADPLLQILALLATTWVAARLFGPWAASWLALGWVGLYPLSAAYLPYAPDERGLACALGLASLLAVLAGFRAGSTRGPEPLARARLRFAAAGILGGLGLWVSVPALVPVLAGVALGGLGAAWIKSEAPPPWRWWSCAGAATVLAAYLAEYFPAHLGGWELRTIHPCFAAAWLGAGEALARGTARIRSEPRGSSRAREAGAWLLAALGLAIVPVVFWRTRDWAFLAPGLTGMRLSRLADAPSAVGLLPWIRAEGMTPLVWATLLPLVLLLPAAEMLRRRATEPWLRQALAIAVGAGVAAAAFACRELQAWDVVDAMLLAVGALVIAGFGARPWSWLGKGGASVLGLGAAAILLIPGALQLAPRDADSSAPIGATEVYQLIERDLAWWLARHAGAKAPVALSPYNLTYTLQYYGGIRGLATLAWNNRLGLEVAVRIASASTPEEAKTLIDGRGVNYIVLPSWDPYLDVYARMGMGELEGTFMSRIHAWLLPPWLRPVPYQVPAIPGFMRPAVLVFAVVPDQDEATATSRIAEYFVDVGQPDQAAAVAATLRRFPANMGAWGARAEGAAARGDQQGVDTALRVLLPRINTGAVRGLPWDQRVDLAILLAETHRLALAREPVRRCLAEASAERLSMLSGLSLYRLLVLGRVFGFAPDTAALRQQALALLPPDMRQRLLGGLSPAGG